MLLLLLPPAEPPDITSIVERPDLGVVPRPVHPAGDTVERPGGGDLVDRPDAATGWKPWTR